MKEPIIIPMFPLSIFPLPGELVPLHIFEPRYRQLLNDAETRDFSFGIFFNHTNNVNKLGSLVVLESIIKKYKTGESDIVVKCVDLFSMGKLYRTYKDKLYPGGEVSLHNIDYLKPMHEPLITHFEEYRLKLKLLKFEKIMSRYDVANELNLGFDERLEFAQLSDDKQEVYLTKHLKYHSALIHKAELSRDIFHLN
jgi:uncharacterized protein